ncbi:carbohydrate binding-domain-containing protein [Lasiosphaeris hirsuta]|uniref:Carbohydrate binding-domain-containing protein n=1 Tax=Lasiosphaeris hirsuta TaxID=260670 RepID=A0AA40A9E4_9PEZI|nr:carbohydrate binding-domain-containing protein [Lasiosphaeris hirsuta]
MAWLPLLLATMLGHGSGAPAALKTCGQSLYDATEYICHADNFLCRITAGEPLSVCGGACYSTFQYACSPGGTLALLPAATAAPFTLAVSNPSLPALHGQPVSAAGGLRWAVGGPTASYCPASVVGPDACPPGNATAVLLAADGRAAMAVVVPGGQEVYLAPDWSVGYTQAHSAGMPAGSVVGGFGAYVGGGFVNLNGDGWGWVACAPPPGAADDARWRLVGRNATSAAALAGCAPVNLKVVPFNSSSVGAWQYT